MWHGGGLTGVTFETTPDGREGWLNMFIRKGWDTYNSNAFERFRIGGGEGTWDRDPAKRKVLPGTQFPVESYDNFVKQIVPRWTTTDSAIIAAYTELVDKVCPCVILFHSQAGQFGFKVAQARPDKVKALVAVEPAGIGDPATAAALKDVPIVMVFGDYIPQDARWPKIRQNDYDFADAVRRGGGNVEVINLPEMG